MANYTTNEQSLLSYLEEQLSQTKGSLTNHTHTHNFWASGEYKNTEAFTVMTQSQINYYMDNTYEKIKVLQFRMKWLESQIDKITLKDLEISK